MDDGYNYLPWYHRALDTGMFKLKSFIDKSEESPWRKAVMSGIFGSFAGVGMGLFFGTFEGAHGDILGNTSYERIKYASKRLLKICWRMSYRYAYNFGIAGAAFAYVDCKLAMARGIDDYLNTYTAGAISGAFFGIIPKLPRLKTLGLGAVLKSGLYGSFGFAITCMGFTKGMEYLHESKLNKSN